MTNASPRALLLNRMSLSSLRGVFRELQGLTIESVRGVYRAEFTGPWLFRNSAGPFMAVTGLRSWWGKEFVGDGDAFNLVRAEDGLRRVLPMKVGTAASSIDGENTLVLTYSADSPLPWRHVVDEIRRLDNGCLMGMTILDLPVTRAAAVPFLLHLANDVEVAGKSCS